MRFLEKRADALTCAHTCAQPPRLDVHAPDLYLPIVGCLAYGVLCCLSLLSKGAFSPASAHLVASRCSLAWAFKSLSLWLTLRFVGAASSAHWLDLVAYAGYPFALLAISAAVALAAPAGFAPGALHYATVAYGAAASGTFAARTLKRVAESSRAAGGGAGHGGGAAPPGQNYALLAVALAQIPYFLVMAVKP